jgi:hypothetical protein
MLSSAVQFPHHLFDFCQDIFVCPYHFITHNQAGLIIRVRDHLTYDESYPNGTLAANWDAVKKIAETLNQMPIETSFHHVKGHQHDKVASKNLSLES